MVILYLAYWSVQDPLTIATGFPHLKVLADSPEVTRVVFVSIERDGKLPEGFVPVDFSNKVLFLPLYSKKNNNLLLNKINDFIDFPKQLQQIVTECKVDKIVGRGAPAGALAYLVWKKLKTPFYVESYEPHADYMVESGVWKRYDPRFLFQKYWEERLKKAASGLLPVSEKYRAKLITEGVPASKVYTVPVPVDTEQFKFDAIAREQVRRATGVPNECIVGIYVGKFGGMYYDKEAFQTFKAAFNFFGEKFRLFILTPVPVEEVLNKLKLVDININFCFVNRVPHKEVPSYLSASDIAFSFMKPTPSLAYSSPTKDGEYWANGLPILLSEGVGDDSDVIKKEGGGAVFNFYKKDLVSAFQQLDSIINISTHRKDIREIALKHRSINNATFGYRILGVVDSSK